MKRLLWPLAVVIVPAILGTAGLLVAHAAPPGPAPPDTIATLRPAAPPSPALTTTSTASSTPRATLAPRQAARPKPHRSLGRGQRLLQGHRLPQVRQGMGIDRPWPGDRSDLPAVVAGYACTGSERPTKLSQSGHQVSFKLTVVSNCAAATQYYTGTDTVRDGKIASAHVTRTG